VGGFEAYLLADEDEGGKGKKGEGEGGAAAPEGRGAAEVYRVNVRGGRGGCSGAGRAGGQEAGPLAWGLPGGCGVALRRPVPV
jgi:hypothetical protein